MAHLLDLALVGIGHAGKKNPSRRRAISLLVDSRLSTTVRFSRRWSAISLAFSKRSGFTSTTWS